MIRISRKVVIICSFLTILTFVAYFSTGITFVVPSSLYEIGLADLLTVLLIYQLGRALSQGSYIPVIYLFPLLPEIRYFSSFLRHNISWTYDITTEKVLTLFSYQTEFDESAVGIVRDRVGFLLKSTFVGLSFAWSLLEFYQNIDSNSSSEIIQAILTTAQSLSGSVPLHYIVAQVGGILLAYASVRAFSLEISHLGKEGRYWFSHRVFGELIAGGILLLIGILFPALQTMYSFVRSFLGFSHLLAAIIVCLLSVSLTTSVWNIFISMLVGFLLLFDLILIVIFAHTVGIHDDLSILALTVIFALFAYYVSIKIRAILGPLSREIRSQLIKTGIIKK